MKSPHYFIVTPLNNRRYNNIKKIGDLKNNTMKANKPKADFFEIVENIAMYAGFLAIVSLILINLFNV